MRLRQLDLRRAPGLGHALRLDDLAPGFNIVLGPNGSGKSSLGRGLAALLWNTPDFQGEVAGSWEVGGAIRTCHRLQGLEPRWEPGGEPPPVLPERMHRSAFSFSVDDFRKALSAKDDEALAAHLRRVLSAGFDLVDAERRLLESRPTTRGLKTASKNLEQARREVQQLQQHHEGLLRRSRQLAELEEDLAAARRARQELESCRLAVQLAEARLQLGAEQTELGLHPQEMERLRGDEGERLAGLASKLDQLRGQRSLAEKSLATVEGHLEALELDHDLPAGLLKELRGHHKAVETAEAELRDLAAREAPARARLEEVGGELDAQGVAVEAEALGRLERLLREAPEREAACQSLRAELDSLAQGVSGEAQDSRPLERGIISLGRWLEGGPEVETEAGRSRPAPTGLLAAALVAGVLGAWFGYSGPPELAALLGLLVAGLLAIVLFTRREPTGEGTTAGASRRATEEREFEALGLEGPTSWEVDSVVRRLGELVKAGQEVAEEEVARSRVKHLEARLARKEEELTDHQQRLEDERRALGLEAPGGHLDLVGAAEQLRLHLEARTELADVLALQPSAEGRLEEALAVAGELLTSHGQAVARSSVELEARIDGLEDLAQTRRGLLEERGRCQRDIEAADQGLESAGEEQLQLLRESGLEGLDEATRRERLDALDEWRQQKELVRDRESDVRSLESRLVEDPELLELDLPGAQDRLARCQAEGGGVEDLEEQCAEIREQVRVAERGRALEQATAEEEERREELRECREQVLQAEAARLLLEEVQEEQAREQSAGLLDEVGSLFARFTGDSYSLRANAKGQAGGLPFEIRENDHEVRRFEHLSSGTRAQLDLALRLGVAADLERSGECLPFVIDEALTTSDPERFAAAVSALCKMVEDGRQVFFLTSDRVDAERLAEAVVENGLEAPPVYELEEQRVEQRRAEGLQVEPLAPVPAPTEGEDFASYARRLGVARIEPFEPVEELHFAYLCQDSLEALHELARERVETVGQARVHLRRSSGTWRPERRKRFEVLARATEAWLEAYRVGRARPLPPEVLLEALEGTKFGEGAVAFCREHGNSAERLIEELGRPGADRDRRFERFRSATLEKLRASLEEKGYLSTEEPSTAEKRRERALDAVGPSLGEDEAVVTSEDIAQLAHALEQWVLGADGADEAS